MTARRARKALFILVAVSSFANVASAQTRETGRAADGFADLEASGNQVAALRATIHMGFPLSTARAALVDIAAAARLDLTFDTSIPGLSTAVSIAPHDRTVAAALLEVADAGRLRVRVGPSGALVILARPPERERSIASIDTTRAVTLPGLRTEVRRFERLAFDSRLTVGEVNVTGHDLRMTPVFVEPDVLRSAQTLPGIGARSDYTAGFNVRGGEADQNLVLLDGYPIFSPFHAGGLFSAFIDPAVSHVDLHTGALPVQFGGRLSSVVDVRSVEHESSDLTASLQASLLSTLGSIGDSFGGDRGSWDVAARRTYIDVVTAGLGEQRLPYHFQDAQAHAKWRLSDDVTMSATAYAGADFVDTTKHNDAIGRWGNGMVGATITKRIERPTLFGLSIGDSATLEQRISTTRFDTRLTEPTGTFHLFNVADDRRLAGSMLVFSGARTSLVGYELSRQRFSYEAATSFDLSGLVPIDSLSQRQHGASLYVDEMWRLTPAFLFDVGARADAFDGRSPIFSPRLGIKYWLGPNTAMTAATAAYAQAEHSLGREEEPIEPIQFWVGTDRSLPVSRARDFTLGVEHWLTSSRLLHAETFYKRYGDLLVPNEASDPVVRGDEFSVEGGSSYGAELLLRQFTSGRFSGWVSYGITMSTRTRSDGSSYRPVQDRRHNFNAVASRRTGNYTLALRANLASGLPYTPLIGGYTRQIYEATSGRYIPVSSQEPIFSPFNQARLPMYQRVDLSATHEGRIGNAPFEWYVSLVNVLNAHNVAAYGYDFTTPPTRWSFPNLPFLPTFGLRIGY